MISKKKRSQAQQAAMGNLKAEIHTVRRIMAQTPDLRAPLFGAPCRCPGCGDWGLVVEVQPSATMNRCTGCHEEWVLTRRAINAVAAAPPPVEVSGGVLFMDPPKSAPVVPGVDTPQRKVERVPTGTGTFVRRTPGIAPA